MTTNTQLRAICPACFKQHAVRDDRLVQHGYTRPHGWHMNNGTCVGTYQKHFGTGDGLVWAMQEVNRIDNYATARRAYAVKADAFDLKELIITKGFGRDTKLITLTPKDAEWKRQCANAASRARSEAASADSHVQWVLQRINTWQETAPVEVKVEASVPAVHLMTKRGNWCAGNFSQNRHSGSSTDDRAKVTCKRCLKLIEYETKRAAATKVLEARARVLAEETGKPLAECIMRLKTGDLK